MRTMSLADMRTMSGDDLFVFEQNSTPAHREHNTVVIIIIFLLLLNEYH